MFLIASCGMAPIDAADTIYLGADIITMVDVQPSAEALAVKGSAILAVGKRADIEKTDMGEATKVVALGGTALLPGFLNAHSHYNNSLLVANQAKL
jgi:predicted amidohydrolase YtcJ